MTEYLASELGSISASTGYMLETPHNRVFTSPQATKCLQVVLGPRLALLRGHVSTTSPFAPQAYKQVQLTAGSVTHTAQAQRATAASSDGGSSWVVRR